MKVQRIILGIGILLMFLYSSNIGVYALEDGQYVVSNTTYYVNPDTSVSDDGGDTSTGEGMCRNAVYSDSLYELKEDKHFVTIRLKLISFIEDVKFEVQGTKGDVDSYLEVEYTVTGKNEEENTQDFRFEVPSTDVLIRPSFFVGPMNRDVTFFVGVDMDTAEADEGTFAAFNDIEEDDESEEADTSVSEDMESQAAEAAEPETPESDTDSEAVEANEKLKNSQMGTESEKASGDDTQAIEEMEESGGEFFAEDQAEGSDVSLEETAPEEVVSNESKTDLANTELDNEGDSTLKDNSFSTRENEETAEAMTDAESQDKEEESKSNNSALVMIIVICIIVIGGYYMKKRKQ